jgi:hypothetical protein
MVVEPKFTSSFLHENKVTKDYLIRDTTAFYAFSLPDKSKVGELAVIVTAISGEVALIVSSA